MQKSHGFTVIELLLAIVVLGTLATLFIVQKNTLDATERDNMRKISINAMYYNLEKSYYPQHGTYPETIDAKTLTAMDPDLFKDPSGALLGDKDSDFRYLPTNCNDGSCHSYSLRSTMEREGDYVKKSLHS